MESPRILFVAPSSYPIYGPEANVNAKVIKMLSDSGCKVDLVCRSLRENIKFYPTSEDKYYFEDVQSINIVSVETKLNFATFCRHLRTLLKTGYVYKGADWTYMAIKMCETLIAKNNYDFIYTYDYPSEIVGLYITKKYDLKWVATWNDPYMWVKYPAPYGKGVNAEIGYFRSKIISDIGKYVYRNVFPSDRLRDYMLRYMVGMNKETCVISPHIILENLVVNNDKKIDNTLRLIHAGALGRERDPENLFKGFSLFLKKNPDAKIEFTFLGIFQRAKDDYFSNLVEKYNVNRYVKFCPPVPYKESLAFIQDYDVCMLIEAACEEGIFLPSKVSDYMQNSKPIMALSPKIGVIHDMYLDGYINYFANITDANSIANSLEILYSDFMNCNIHINNSGIDRYGSKNVYQRHKDQIFR